jgi:hypothetical protein
MVIHANIARKSPATGGTNRVHQSEESTGEQNNASPIEEHNPNQGNPGHPGGGDSGPPDNNPPHNSGDHGFPKNNERGITSRRSRGRHGRGGGPPDGPPSSSGSSGCGSRASSRSDWNENCPPAPYGDYIPIVKMDIKLEQLPTWDGNHDTAIDYFWKIQQLAAMKGYLPQALGYWLWMNLKEESTVCMWFTMCSHEQQEYMRSHYVAYMRGIKEGYLGHTWQMKMNATYENQSF